MDEAAELMNPYGLDGAVWISPAGTTVDAVLNHTKALADHVIERGFCLGTRLHVLAWGDERGR